MQNEKMKLRGEGNRVGEHYCMFGLNSLKADSLIVREFYLAIIECKVMQITLVSDTAYLAQRMHEMRMQYSRDNTSPSRVFIQLV
jgi:hypothetical protein